MTFTIKVVNLPDDDEMLQDVIDSTKDIVAVWHDRNDYGASWSVASVEVDR